jgi:outer membrane protein assembly factor BamB
MLTFNVNQYTIIIKDATSQDLDNLSGFDALYLNDDGYKHSMQAIHLHRDGVPLKSILLGADGGGTGVYDNTALLDNYRVVTCCADTVFCLSVAGLDLLWKTKADIATCFAVYQYQQDYIVHGELEISRLDREGNIIWQVGGADAFVTLEGNSAIILYEDSIVAMDFEYSKYVFDYDGNTISYTKAH